MKRSTTRSTISRRSFLGRGTATVAGLLLSSNCASAPQNQSNKNPGLTAGALQSAIPELMQRYAVPGVSIALIEDARIVWSQGFGVKSAVTKDPVTTETVFEAASISKPVFAALVLKMCAEKILNLDEPLGDYFRMPDLQGESQVDLITPRIVLSHRTGLQNWRPATDPLRFQFKPGTDFSYSGEAYVRLQRVVEKKAGRSLTDLARSYVFEPVAMKHSSYIWRDDFEQNAAEGHNAAGKVVRTRLWKYSPDSPQAMKLPPGVDIPLFAIPNAAASLYSTPSDYAAFMIELVNHNAKSGMKLPEEFASLMFTPLAKVNLSISWGLGWGIADVGKITTFWHWGNNDVYQGFVIGCRKQKSGVAIMTNSQNGLKLCRDVITKIIGAEHPAFSWPMVLK